MKKFVTLCVVSSLISTQVASQYFPDRELPELFKDVQLKGIFPDSKTFADAVPLKPIAAIQADYKKQKANPDFNLTTFVSNNFSITEARQPPVPIKSLPPITDHIETLWSALERPPILRDSGSLLALPNPYIVPGGRFNEIYYWDSYFTMLGLEVSGRQQLMQHITANFGDLLNRYGFIPNGNRSYYLTRSQPPFFAMMVDLVAKGKDSAAVYKDYLPQLLQEYSFWMKGADQLTDKNRASARVVMMDNGVILNRYWDNSNTPRPESFKEDMQLANYADTASIYREIKAACESGWDFSSRWLKNEQGLASIHTTDFIPVDLNCLLYHLEQTIARAYRLKSDHVRYREYMHKASRRKQAILTYCWDAASSFFTDYDFTAKKGSPVLSLAGMYPLFYFLADSIQAKQAAITLQKYFLYDGGVVTTTRLTHQQWDAPNGWAPLQYISYAGLINYGAFAIADSISARWVRTIETSYSRTGKLMEKYNVLYPQIPGGGGEYPSQDGFGWTNGVYLYFKSKLKN